jgi:hypothetical protein
MFDSRVCAEFASSSSMQLARFEKQLLNLKLEASRKMAPPQAQTDAQMVNNFANAQNDALPFVAFGVFAGLALLYWGCRWLCCPASEGSSGSSGEVMHGLDDEEEDFRRSLELRSDTRGDFVPTSISKPHAVAERILQPSTVNVAEADTLEEL